MDGVSLSQPGDRRKEEQVDNGSSLGYVELHAP